MQYQGNNWNAIERDNYHTLSGNKYDCTYVNKNINNISYNVYDNDNNDDYSFNTNNMKSVVNNANNTSFVSYNVPSSVTNSRCIGFDGTVTVHNTLNIIHENENNNNSNNSVNINKFINRCNKQNDKELDSNL